MTPIFTTALVLLAAYSIYISTTVARTKTAPTHFTDGGRDLPTWSYMFAGAGVMISGLGLLDHFLLASRYGLQYSHVGLALVLAAMASATVQKRARLAAVATGLVSPASLVGKYFGSVTIRLYVVAIACLFGMPFAAAKMSELGTLLSAAGGGGVGRESTIWIVGFVLFLTSVIGGWRGTVLVTAGTSLLMAIGLLFVGAFAAATLPGLAFFSIGIATPAGILADRIPGVIQFSSGIGKQVAQGGPWTTISILTFSLSIVGLALSPGMIFLGNTTATKTGFAFKQVWVVAGVGAGLLLLITPFVAAEIASSADGMSGLVQKMRSADTLLGVFLLVVMVAAAQVVVAFLASSAATCVMMDVVEPYVLPNLSRAAQRLATRIALVVVYLAICLIASFAPASAVVLSSVTLSLSVQLAPALLGLCWVAWISRSAVIVGLIIGSIMVVFTEPLGLVVWEGLFFDLPWGRWPLTIHSAAWGLVFNVGATLLVAIFTRDGVEREYRERLHRALTTHTPAKRRGRNATTAKWSLTLLWAFLALGPGAILGNTFFSQAIFTSGEAALGVPSLWVWQLLFWFVGVLLVWWLAYSGGLSNGDEKKVRVFQFDDDNGLAQVRRTPSWIEQGLARVAGQSRRR